MSVPRRRIRVAAVAFATASLLVACGSDDGPSETELRNERIATRLTATFPRAQADCIIDALDETTLTALDRDAELAGDSEALATYSGAVRSCVEDPSAPVTTTTAAPTTTTAPPAATTTAPAGEG